MLFIFVKKKLLFEAMTALNAI